jgi:hypothetical protein
MELNDYEKVIKEIEHSNRIPFRLEDLISVPFFICWCYVVLLIFEPYTVENIRDYGGLYHYGMLLLVILAGMYVTIGRIFTRWIKTKKVVFFVTNQRVIFCNRKNGNISKSFDLSDLQISIREKSNNSGFIILGEKESFFRRRG